MQKLPAGIIGSSWKTCILNQISLKPSSNLFPAALVGSISGVSTGRCWAGRPPGQSYHAGSGAASFTSCGISTVIIPSIPCPGVGWGMPWHPLHSGAHQQEPAARETDLIQWLNKRWKDPFIFKFCLLTSPNENKYGEIVTKWTPQVVWGTIAVTSCTLLGMFICTADRLYW